MKFENDLALNISDCELSKNELFCNTLCMIIKKDIPKILHYRRFRN